MELGPRCFAVLHLAVAPAVVDGKGDIQKGVGQHLGRDPGGASNPEVEFFDGSLTIADFLGGTAFEDLEMPLGATIPEGRRESASIWGVIQAAGSSEWSLSQSSIRQLVLMKLALLR